MSHAEYLFEQPYDFLLPILILTLYIRALRIVTNTRWQAHARWIKPCLAAHVLYIAHDIIYNIYDFTGLHLSNSVYFAARLCRYVGNAIVTYGIVLLVKTLRQMVNGTLPDLTPAAPHTPLDPGTWPPPPNVPH